MIATEKLTLSFGGQTLFEDVTVKFTADNCYGLIGANGAGKSTFLKILSGEVEPSKGNIFVEKGKRIAVLKQDQFAYEDNQVLETVMMGFPELYEVYSERNAIYAKGDMTDEEGLRVGDLEVKFGEMDGYTREAEAATMLSDLGIAESLHDKTMKELESGEKIRVLLAQALFGDPDILLLDEPTNQLDYASELWLEKFLLDFKNTVIVISHDRHFLNKVCTHIADLDYKQIKIFVGNYDFWQKSSHLISQQAQDQRKKTEDKIKELEEFVRRFSANASKSKQATSRKKLIDKLQPGDLPVSSRRSPYINFKPVRKCPNTILTVKNLSHSIEGTQVLNNVSFKVFPDDKIAVVSQNTLSKSALVQILAGEITPDSGTVEWGDAIRTAYFPKDNSAFFDNSLSLLDWLNQFSEDADRQVVRGFLGRMLFSGDDVDKKVSVLSGGEKARAMFAKMMLAEGNVLLFEDPTDHLDLESITSLNDGLEAFPEVLIFTSHDFQLLNTVSNRIIEVSPNGMLDRKTSFDDYMQSDTIAPLRTKLYEG